MRRSVAGYHMPCPATSNTSSWGSDRAIIDAVVADHIAFAATHELAPKVARPFSASTVSSNSAICRSGSPRRSAIPMPIQAAIRAPSEIFHQPLGRSRAGVRVDSSRWPPQPPPPRQIRPIPRMNWESAARRGGSGFGTMSTARAQGSEQRHRFDGLWRPRGGSDQNDREASSAMTAKDPRVGLERIVANV